MNAVVLASMFGAGWCGVSGWEPWLAPSRAAASELTGAPAYEWSIMWADATRIVVRNLVAFTVLVALGACTGGIYGWLVLALNGYGLGRVVSSVVDQTPGLISLVLSYAPLEFGAMVLGATVGQCLGVHVARWVVSSRPVPVSGASRAFGVGLVLLLLAGVLEAEAMQRAGAGPR